MRVRRLSVQLRRTDKTDTLSNPRAPPGIDTAPAPSGTDAAASFRAGIKYLDFSPLIFNSVLRRLGERVA